MIGWFAWAALVVPATCLIATGRAFSPWIPAMAVQAAGLAVVFWARIVFGVRSFHAGSTTTAGGLVTTGPYRYVRHPIYAGALLMVLGALIGHHDVIALACGTGVGLGLGARIWAEEREVRRTYPEYAEYAKRTRRLVPFVF